MCRGRSGRVGKNNDRSEDNQIGNRRWCHAFVIVYGDSIRLDGCSLSLHGTLGGPRCIAEARRRRAHGAVSLDSYFADRVEPSNK